VCFRHCGVATFMDYVPMPLADIATMEQIGRTMHMPRSTCGDNCLSDESIDQGFTLICAMSRYQ
jgi:hypothetical protein